MGFILLLLGEELAVLNFLEVDEGVFQATSVSRRGSYMVVDQGDHWSIDSPTCDVEFNRKHRCKERAFEVCEEVEAELEQIDEAATRRNWAEVYSLERRWQEV